MGLPKRLFGDTDEGWQASFTTGPVVHTTSKSMVLTGDEARQALEGIEKATGMDIDDDGKVGDVAAPGAPTSLSMAAGAQLEAAGADDVDVISQLERLPKLRESGALTAAEFAAQKAKLLAR